MPFDLPDGFGGIVYEVDTEKPIRKFHEPYTNTNSWILIEEEFNIVENEIHYVVIFSKANQSGKFWFATGTKEVFDFASPQLYRNILKVKTFHKPSTLSTNVTSLRDNELGHQSRLQGSNYLKSINVYFVAILFLSLLMFILVKKKLR